MRDYIPNHHGNKDCCKTSYSRVFELWENAQQRRKSNRKCLHQNLDVESYSRTYLQELFGSFPFTNVSGDEVQNDDINEGEYESYEQDTNDSYSGDDDNRLLIPADNTEVKQNPLSSSSCLLT